MPEPLICATCGEEIDPAVIDQTFEVWGVDGKARHLGRCPTFEAWVPPPDGTTDRDTGEDPQGVA